MTLTDVTFDAALRDAMAAEASLFLGEMFRGGHAVKELLSADFLFANDRLAAHYGLTGTGTLGSALVKLPLTDSRRSGGILTQANTLTVTSMRDRTSPTRRGKWVSENLLCVVIPPPPPMIPQLRSAVDHGAHQRARAAGPAPRQGLDLQRLPPVHRSDRLRAGALRRRRALARHRQRRGDRRHRERAGHRTPRSTARSAWRPRSGDDPRFLDCMIRRS